MNTNMSGDRTPMAPGEEQFLRKGAELTGNLVGRSGVPVEMALIIGLVLADLSEWVGQNFDYKGGAR